MTEPVGTRAPFALDPRRTAEVLQASTARLCILLDSVTDLRDELNEDPMAHSHPLDDGEGTDCLGCVVAARLTDMLTEDERC